MKFCTEHIDRANDGHGWYLPAIEQDGFGFGILTVTAGSTGRCGGDSGHGGESFVKLHMEGGDLSVSADGKKFEDATDLIISVGGDWELDGLINGFRFAAEVLESIKNIKEFVK